MSNSNNMKKTIIAIAIASLLAITAVIAVMPSINKVRMDRKNKTECMIYQMEYSALSPIKTYDQEEYLQQSYEIYRGLCDIMMRIKLDDVYLNESIRHSLDEIFQDQVTTIRSMDDVLLQSKYIRDILSKEMKLLHQVGDQYEEMVRDELRKMNI